MNIFKRKQIILAVGIFVVAIAGVSLLFLNTSSQSSTNQPSVANPISQKTEQADRPEIMLELPGARPIRALHENYYEPSSLWVVVNKDHPLTRAEYAPNDLQQPAVATNTQKSLEEQQLRRTIANATESFFTAAKQAGHDLFVASGYRSYSLQEKYYTNYVRISGEAEANMYSAKPGTSEHQTGIAFDVSLADRQCYLEVCFGETVAGKWLAEHAAEYGFILRYPADKTAITKYQYEPWHFRYVGKELAGALRESGLTLDEALPYLERALDKLKQEKLI